MTPAKNCISKLVAALALALMLALVSLIDPGPCHNRDARGPGHGGGY